MRIIFDAMPSEAAGISERSTDHHHQCCVRVGSTVSTCTVIGIDVITAEVEGAELTTDDEQLVRAVLQEMGCERVRFIPNGTSNLFKRDVFVAYNVPGWFEPFCGVTGQGYSCPDLLHDRNAVAEVVGRLNDTKLVSGTGLTELETWYDALTRIVPWDGKCVRLVLATPLQQLQAYWEVRMSNLRTENE